jgi:single-strand DNA-binding protein
MLNKVILLGRICKDLELKQAGATNVVKFNLAVNRKFTKQGEEKQTDFISCVAFRKTAETIVNYLSKGRQIVVEGRIQTGNYEKDGQRIYTTDVIVESFNFADGKQNKKSDEFFDSNTDDELPF